VHLLIVFRLCPLLNGTMKPGDGPTNNGGFGNGGFGNGGFGDGGFGDGGSSAPHASFA